MQLFSEIYDLENDSKRRIKHIDEKYKLKMSEHQKLQEQYKETYS